MPVKNVRIIMCGQVSLIIWSTICVASQQFLVYHFSVIEMPSMMNLINVQTWTLEKVDARKT